MSSLYDISIPVMTSVLKALSLVLKKGEQHAKANNISETDLLGARIYEDMIPLTNQILIVVSTIRYAIRYLTETQLAQIEGLTAKHDLRLEELYQLIDGALQDLAAVKRESLDGQENKEIVFHLGPHFVKKATATGYIHGYTVPYVFFHLNITYAILRQQGVPLRKLDYINEFSNAYFEDA
jgi:hypothetical protein